jgi:hypothetical protein
MPDLQTVLDASRGKVNSPKLAKLERSLEAALGQQLRGCALEDPIVVRRELVNYLREHGESRGNLQAIEQFYMGVIRRAAVQGLIQAPPEGPWTRIWQSVLDFAESKALIRTLAAWATDNRLEPGDISTEHLEEWADAARVDRGLTSGVAAVLDSWRRSPGAGDVRGRSMLTQRLLKKARCGTVRASE